MIFSHEQPDVVCIGGLDHSGRFINVHRNRLFDNDVLPGIESRDGHRFVQDVGGGDIDGVYQWTDECVAQ